MYISIFSIGLIGICFVARKSEIENKQLLAKRSSQENMELWPAIPMHILFFFSPVIVHWFQCGNYEWCAYYLLQWKRRLVWPLSVWALIHHHLIIEQASTKVKDFFSRWWIINSLPCGLDEKSTIETIIGLVWATAYMIRLKSHYSNKHRTGNNLEAFVRN